ncbi:uncharacterized protein LOC132310012 [Cornus florida]|uniref:uncharacterized protein LOC132310012 n=1 Tax=Cornus florida TaxID=4283 RepID=UPI002896578E|nr:uncharacterized protein LOC132310012 [Cornus florida]
MMTDAEARYSKTEKIILALVYAKRKLRHYFESHSIVVLTNYPMQAILSKPDLSGRITKWAIELSSFNIAYEPKVSHKGQALADFLLEYEDKPEKPELPEPYWELRVNGSSNLTSARARVVVTTPKSTKLQQLIRLNFPATDNEAEYEALLAELRLANQLQVKNLKVFSDSQLIVNQQIHDGDCDNHSGGRSLAHKVLTQGYFWPYLARNAEEYTRRYDQCQQHGLMKHQPAEDLHAMANPWPFAQWGIDMVGLLPKVVEQKEYILLATDYFTKWVEVEAYSSMTHEQVKSFIWNNIIYRFKVPKVIMMDNGKNLDNRSTRKFFAEHRIRMKLAAVSYPQGNGQVEITNRTIFGCLKKRLEKFKSKWYEKLPEVL